MFWVTERDVAFAAAAHRQRHVTVQLVLDPAWRSDESGVHPCLSCPDLI
jgi:hypothetical protein